MKKQIVNVVMVALITLVSAVNICAACPGYWDNGYGSSPEGYSIQVTPPPTSCYDQVEPYTWGYLDGWQAGYNDMAYGSNASHYDNKKAQKAYEIGYKKGYEYGKAKTYYEP